MARLFGVKLVNELRSRIRAIAEDLIDQVSARGEMSFLQDFAGSMAARVTSELLGIPEADIPEFTRDVYALAPALSSSFSRDDVPQLESAAEKLTRYAEKLLREREDEPRDDFLSSYIGVLGQSDTLTPLETVIQIVTVILAGSETTRSAMTLQTSLLLEHRDQWDAQRRICALLPYETTGNCAASQAARPPAISIKWVIPY